MSRLWLALGAVLVFLLLQTGCVWQRGRTNIADLHERIGQVQVGKTTGSDLIRVLGSPPNNIIQTADGGRVYLYVFGDSKTKGFRFPFFLEISKSNIGVDSALFILDKNDVVSFSSASTNSKDLPWEWWAFGEDEDGS